MLRPPVTSERMTAPLRAPGVTLSGPSPVAREVARLGGRLHHGHAHGPNWPLTAHKGRLARERRRQLRVATFDKAPRYGALSNGETQTRTGDTTIFSHPSIRSWDRAGVRISAPISRRLSAPVKNSPRFAV